MMNARQRYYKRNAAGPRTSREKKGVLLAVVLVAVISAVTGVFLAGSHLLSRSDFFQITTIDIQGCEKTAKRQILEYSGIDIHSNLFALDTDAVRTRIESSPWVRRADVEKKWPNELVITVIERSPVAMANLEGTLYYVDKTGSVFAEVLPPGEMDYPVITGLPAGVVGNPEMKRALEEALRFIDYASKGNLNLPVQNISEINVSDSGNFVLFLVDRPFPIHLGEVGKGLKTRYSRLAKVLEWLYRKKKIGTTKYINMRYMTEKILVGQNPL